MCRLTSVCSHILKLASVFLIISFSDLSCSSSLAQRSAREFKLSKYMFKSLRSSLTKWIFFLSFLQLSPGSAVEAGGEWTCSSSDTKELQSVSLIKLSLKFSIEFWIMVALLVAKSSFLWMSGSLALPLSLTILAYSFMHSRNLKTKSVTSLSTNSPFLYVSCLENFLFVPICLIGARGGHCLIE
ncbi:hypothetical protein BpHYR1_004680 [Brachionus plicatilis]|uniref:Uncharacterized protein n=1 Tax=Brachionus plicatilis TaxID=10195 RepID=A0A3M7R3G9_BRAPC|nr:hypothetical protein BpHYR1_004680 [Brachionus plicatilis]